MRGSFRERAAQARADLSKQHQKSYDSRDDKGSAVETVFDIAVLKEMGIEEWKPDKGEHLIDVIPFFAGPDHPEIGEGDLAYNVDYWAHQLRDIGRFFVCQRLTYRGTDPICIYIQKNRPEKDEWKRIKPTRRCAYLIWCHDNEKEEAKGIQVWDVSHYFFEKNVCAIQKDPKTGKPIVWSSFEKGKSVFFTISKNGSFEDSSGKKHDSMEFSGFQFVDRDNPMIPDHILDQSFSLDSAMRMHPDDEEVSNAFYDGQSVGNSQQQTDDSHEQEQEQEQEQRSAKSALERAKERVAQRKQIEEQAEAEEQALVTENEEAGVDPDTLDKEPEAVQETKASVSNSNSDIYCPQAEIGGEFGVTIEQLAECDDCDMWRECKKRYHELKSEPKQTTSAPETTTSKPRLMRRS